MILLFGVGKSVLKQVYVDNCNCSHCKQTVQHRFTVTGHYFSFFFIPVIPLFKTTKSECVHCRIELSKNSWNLNLREKFDRATAMQPPKRPWWHFLGCMISMLIILFFSAILAYGYYKVKDDPEVIQMMNDMEEANDMIFEENVPIEPEEPIDSITSFFKN